ncbi:MAG: hypothetical protein DRP66_04845, partial [Planctomycetota bacterium]
MVSRKSLYVLSVGVSILVAPALLAQYSAGGERIYSPLTAETFHRVAREVSTDAVGDKDPAAEAMAFLNAAMDLDPRATYLYEDMLVLGSQSAEAEAEDVSRFYDVFRKYITKTSNFEVLRQAVRYMLSTADTRQEREDLLLRLIAVAGVKNPVLTSELAAEYGQLAVEKADFENARKNFEQAYHYNEYNQLAFARFDELLRKEDLALSPAVYASNLRRAININPLSIEAALGFAQYCEEAGVYDVAAEAYEYAADLFEYLSPDRDPPVSIYLPWALMSYNTPNLRAKCLDAAARVRQSGRFDIRMEALAGSAAGKMGNIELSKDIFAKAGRRAAQMLGDGAVSPQVTALELGWFYSFANPNDEQALAWANRAFMADPNAPGAKAIFAHVLAMQGEYDLAGEYAAGIENDQIAQLTKAMVRLSEKKTSDAIEMLKAAIAMDPASLVAQKAKALLAENGSDYILPTLPEIVREHLKKEFGKKVLSRFRPARDIFSVKLNLGGSNYSYGSEFDADLIITNKSPNPIVISDSGIFKGNIRVDAVVSGDIMQEIRQLISKKAVPSLPIEPGHYASIPLDLMTGKLRRLLLAFPQASVEVEFIVYLDPVPDAAGEPTNFLKEIEPVRNVLKREGVNLTRQYFMQRLDTLAGGQEGQKNRAVQLFAGLLVERDFMTRSGSLYRYIRVERPILVDAVKCGLTDANWKVKVQAMESLGLLSGSLDYELTRAVSSNLSDDHWPVRMMALYTLSKS